MNKKILFLIGLFGLAVFATSRASADVVVSNPGPEAIEITVVVTHYEYIWWYSDYVFSSSDTVTYSVGENETLELYDGYSDNFYTTYAQQ